MAGGGMGRGNSTSMQRGTEGKPEVQKRGPIDELKNEIFVVRRRELEALFPADGKEIVNRLEEVGREFGVTKTNVSFIVRRKTWKHI